MQIDPTSNKVSDIEPLRVCLKLVLNYLYVGMKIF